MSKRVPDRERALRRTSQALERYLEGMQHERRPRRPHQMTPDQVRMYQMAALFRVVSPGATTPDPGFVARLQEQVAAALSIRPCKDKEQERHDTHFGRR